MQVCPRHFRSSANSMSTRNLAAVLIVSALLLLAPRAEAEDLSAAVDAFTRGARHYDLGEFKEALDAFKEAYRLQEDPALLYNIAACYRQLGDRHAALRTYKTYLAKFPDVPNRDRVRVFIAELEKAIAE